MRFVEFAGGLRQPVSGEELELLDRIPKDGVTRASLDEREQEIAFSLCSRGILRRFRDTDGKLRYASALEEDLWRH